MPVGVTGLLFISLRSGLLSKGCKRLGNEISLFICALLVVVLFVSGCWSKLRTCCKSAFTGLGNGASSGGNEFKNVFKTRLILRLLLTLLCKVACTGIVVDIGVDCVDCVGRIF